MRATSSSDTVSPAPRRPAPIIRNTSRALRRPDPKRSASALQLDDAQQGIFQALRSWRAGAAKEQSVPAYVVFNDKTLAAIAERRPATIVELSTISGVGESKLERYGEAVLAVLAEA